MSEDFPNISGHCVLYLKSLLIALALVFDLYGAVHLPCPSDCSYAGWRVTHYEIMYLLHTGFYSSGQKIIFMTTAILVWQEGDGGVSMSVCCCMMKGGGKSKIAHTKEYFDKRKN